MESIEGWSIEVGEGFDPESATESVGPTTITNFFSTSFLWLLSSSAVSKYRLPVA